MPVTYPVKEVFAWVVDDPTEEHKLFAVLSPHLPLEMQAVSTERRIIDKSRGTAQAAARDINRPIMLQRFVLAETLETLKP